MRSLRFVSIAVLLAAALALSACSAAPRPAPAQPSREATPAAGQLGEAAAAAPAQPLTLIYWEQDSDDADVLLDELAAEFTKSHPAIQIVRVHFGYEELRSHFQEAAAGGQAPDLVRAPGDFAGSFSELGIVQPAEPLFDRQMLDQFLPGALAGAVVRGTLWAVPDNYGNHLMLVYNKKLVQQVPADTDAWIAQLKTLTDAAREQYGLAYYLNEPFWLVPWIGGFGGWPLDDSDQPALATPAVVNALQFVRDLKLTYHVVPAEADYAVAADLFERGQAAYVVDGEWNLERYRQVGVDFGLATLPRVSKTGLRPVPMTAGTAGKYWFVSKDVAGTQLKAAQEFVKFMTAAQAQAEWLVKMGRLPSHWAVAHGEPIARDPLLAASMAQLELGRGMPAAPEMRCAWSGMAMYLQAVMDGKLSPADASIAMQAEAQRCVAEIKAASGATPIP